ncbi:hypothetical protein CAEBREN_28980 [Caenorhabditis brenneri]|uniref:Uncharacterized protein n=2 Tax=Caenorhabditis brenneri TaxID=135651 RepID=G0P2Y4_CAEBE|nr:hypothetical protein CAEBREN_28980 [Caenorhabditis brenneri]
MRRAVPRIIENRLL